MTHPMKEEVLDVQMNDSEDPVQKRIEKCKTLKNGQEMDLSDLNLTELPDSMLSLSSLRTLNLRNNKLETLPDDFSDIFPKLQILNLSNNSLVELPTDFGMLQHLKKLYLQGNQINELPSSIGGLLSLEELYLQHNKLESLEFGISLLNNLKTLSVASNKLSTIPVELKNLENLQIVDLSGNTLEYVPEKIRRLHDKHVLLHSRERRRELIQRALRVRGAVKKSVQREIRLQSDRND